MTKNLLFNRLMTTVAAFSATGFMAFSDTLVENFEAMAPAPVYGGTIVECESGAWNIFGFTGDSDTDRKIGAKSVRFRGGSKDNGNSISGGNMVEMNFDKTGGLGTVTFKYGSYSTHKDGEIALYYSVDGGSSWSEVGKVVASAWGADMETATFDINVAGNGRIRLFKKNQAGSTSVNIDDITITDYAEVSTPAITAPSTLDFGPITAGETATDVINVRGSHLTGDLSVALAGTGFATTVSSISKADAEAGFAIPVSFSSAAAGTFDGSITISGGGIESKVIALSAKAVKTTAASIEELRTFEADNSTIYTLSGEALITFINGRNKFVEDATGAILVFDNSTAVLPADFVVGDKIAGIQGKLTTYNQLLEFIPTTAGSKVSSGNALPEPVVATVADINANYVKYESRMVTVQNVLLTYKVMGEGSDGNTDLTQGDDIMFFRNHFKTLTGYETPAENVNVTGFVICFNNDRQICPRGEQDITLATSISEVAGNDVIYGANGAIIVNAEEAAKVEVFSITGQVVNVSNVTDGINTIAAERGLYIVRKGGKTVKVTVK